MNPKLLDLLRVKSAQKYTLETIKPLVDEN